MSKKKHKDDNEFAPDIPHRLAACACMDSNDGSVLMVVVCLGPLEAYANKNQKHIGFIVDGVLVKNEKSEATVDAHDEAMMLMTYWSMKNMLTNIDTLNTKSPMIKQLETKDR